ncbi:IS110 family transposase [Actinomyces respiraculi]
MQVDDIGVFVGTDVGKCEHWATALTTDGKRLFDKALPNDEARLRALYETLACHGRLLVVVDQVRHHQAPWHSPSPRTWAFTVGYLPGPSMRRIADRCPGNAKTHARDAAAVTAQAARTMAHTLRSVSASDEDAAALSMLTGSGPGPGPPGQPDHKPHPGARAHPGPAPPWPRSWAPGSSTTPSFQVIATWPTPTTLRKTDRARIAAKPRDPRRPDATPPGRGPSPTPLAKPTVVVAGTSAAGIGPAWPDSWPPRTPTDMTSPARSRPRRVAHPLLPGPHHPCPGQGPRPPQSSSPKPPAEPSPSGTQLASHTRPDPRHQTIGHLHQRRAHLPRRQQAPQACHVRLHPSPHHAPTPPPGPTTTARPPKATTPWAKPSPPRPTNAPPPRTP